MVAVPLNHLSVLWVALGLQAISAAFFVGDILISVLGLSVGPFNWLFVELIQIGAAFGLIIGLVMGAVVLRQSHLRTKQAEASLRQARSAFRDLLEERFRSWDLTPAERDVAMFSIKGFSTTDIASFRSVSEGTVKAQTNAIYRKAGVSGRAQLLSLFVDELVADDQSPPA